MDNNTVYEWILHSTFTVTKREESLQSAKPYLSAIFTPGDEILDLCCGSGFVSFWFEEQGAKVTGIDLAPYMLSLAEQEAAQRNSTVEFLLADIFTHDFGQERFHLISCFDSVSDFPALDFARLGRKIAQALKPGGRFVIKYWDGSSKYIQGSHPREGVYQETPERVTFRIKEYLPDIGAIVNTIRNETRGEVYDRRGYIYTPTIVHLALCNVLKREQHISLSENEYLDVFKTYP